MDEFDGPGKIIRARSLKRGKAEERITDRIKLERVLDNSFSNAALTCDNNGLIAYPAGFIQIRKLGRPYH
ncbi:hypothetical protein JTB14_003733 [Gonioctena quinquepunctata]|nr:hypothetical protein JTB14_003733 [Gonioctena quinquepunctata]